MTRSTVLIIGYGEMGHAMQALLADRHELIIWNRRPVEGLEPVDLLQATTTAEYVIYCIPVTPLAEVAARILPSLQPHSLSLVISKGLDEAGRTAPQALASVYGDSHAFGVLYGPMIAEEMIHGRPGFAQVAAQPAADCRRIAALFADSRLYSEPSQDMTGIAWSVILKNVYAILFGVADGLQLGDNVRGFLVVAALRELSRLVEVLGGDVATAYRLAGLGDLVATATSDSSHHHALGVRLSRGDRSDIAGEGVHTLAMVRQHGLLDTGSCPLYELAQAIVDGTVDVSRCFTEYLQQPMV